MSEDRSAFAQVPLRPETRTYYAISLFSSRTFWWNAANGLLALLSLSEINVLIPPRFVPLQLAVVAMVNLYLRTVTVRPVAIIAPGDTKPITVPKVGPPDPPLVTD
jgi:hypothetical protein